MKCMCQHAALTEYLLSPGTARSSREARHARQEGSSGKPPAPSLHMKTIPALQVMTSNPAPRNTHIYI